MSPVDGLTYVADEGSSPSFSKISISHSGLWLEVVPNDFKPTF